MRLVIAFAFVPVADGNEAFEEIAATYSQETTALLDYFKDAYLGRPERHCTRYGALFPPACWNMFNRVMDNVPRINKPVELWHSTFHSNMGTYHSTLWIYKRIAERRNKMLCYCSADHHKAKTMLCSCQLTNSSNRC